MTEYVVELPVLRYRLYVTAQRGHFYPIHSLTDASKIRFVTLPPKVGGQYRFSATFNNNKSDRSVRAI
jgi:hypothetical protein